MLLARTAPSTRVATALKALPAIKCELAGAPRQCIRADQLSIMSILLGCSKGLFASAVARFVNQDVNSALKGPGCAMQGCSNRSNPKLP